jgi:hypothetical protein
MENNTLKNPGFRPSEDIAGGDVPIDPKYSSGQKPIVKKQGGVQSALNSDILRNTGLKFTALVEEKSPSGRVR